MMQNGSAASFIDFLSFTFKSEMPLIDVRFLFDALRPIIPSIQFSKREMGIFFYKHSWSVYRDEQQAGIIACGGSDGNQTVYCSLSGFGCAAIDITAMHALLASLSGLKITRVDIAHDRLDGDYNVKTAQQYYEDGLFQMKFSPKMPIAKHISDMGSGAGCTFYVGKRENGKQMRVYEKGKHLGDPNSPWVRWEVEYRSRDRVIPIDVLIQPDEYLRASYPCMTFVAKCAKYIETVKKTAEIGYKKLRDCGKMAYGRLINVMEKAGMTHDEIISELKRSGEPRRLIMSTVIEKPDLFDVMVGVNHALFRQRAYYGA